MVIEKEKHYKTRGQANTEISKKEKTLTIDDCLDLVKNDPAGVKRLKGISEVVSYLAKKDYGSIYNIAIGHRENYELTKDYYNQDVRDYAAMQLLNVVIKSPRRHYYFKRNLNNLAYDEYNEHTFSEKIRILVGNELIRCAIVNKDKDFLKYMKSTYGYPQENRNLAKIELEKLNKQV